MIFYYDALPVPGSVFFGPINHQSVSFPFSITVNHGVILIRRSQPLAVVMLSSLYLLMRQFRAYNTPYDDPGNFIKEKLIDEILRP